MKDTITTIKDAYVIDQNAFHNMGARGQADTEQIYHLRQIHRLLYILAEDKLKDDTSNAKVEPIVKKKRTKK